MVNGCFQGLFWSSLQTLIVLMNAAKMGTVNKFHFSVGMPMLIISDTMKICKMNCRSRLQQREQKTLKGCLQCRFLWGGGNLPVTGDCGGQCYDLVVQLFFVPQWLSVMSTLKDSYLTVTIVRISVGSTTWTIHIVSGFPASPITITVTTETVHSCS